jgi:hypothetical protein
MSEAPIPREVVQYLQSLERRVKKLEETSSDSESSMELASKQITEMRTLLPDTAVISHSYVRRAFAIWGHYFIAQLIISIPLYCIAVILIVALGEY